MSQVIQQIELKIAPHPAIYVSFLSEVNPTTARSLLALIAEQMMAGVKQVHLLISSPGGSVACGVAVYNSLRSLPIEVTTYNTGSVNSIANVIYLAGSRRVACAASSFMFHAVGIDLPSQTRIEARNIRELSDNLHNDQAIIAGIVADNTGMDLRKVGELFLNAAFIPAKEAKALGIVHDIADFKAPPGAPFFQLTFQN